MNYKILTSGVSIKKYIRNQDKQKVEMAIFPVIEETNSIKYMSIELSEYNKLISNSFNKNKKISLNPFEKINVEYIKEEKNFINNINNIEQENKNTKVFHIKDKIINEKFLEKLKNNTDVISIISEKEFNRLINVGLDKNKLGVFISIEGFSIMLEKVISLSLDGSTESKILDHNSVIDKLHNTYQEYKLLQECSETNSDEDYYIGI